MGKTALDRTGTVAGFKQALDDMLNQKPEGIFILACDENGFAPERMNPLLKKVNVPVFGGIFPSIVYGPESLKKGTILAGFTKRPRVQVIPNLCDDNVSHYVIDENLVTDDTRTMFVLVDGLSMKVATLLDSIFDIFGAELNYLGGGAGSVTTLQPSPCLFTSNGLVQNSALLVAIDNSSSIEVTHGLKSVSGPHVITKSEGSTVYTIDLKPVYPFFKEASQRFLLPKQTDNFPLVSKYFSFGLNRLGTEKVIREPAKVIENKAMVFGTDMFEGELIDIMKADDFEVIESLRQTIERSSHREMSEGILIIFDCISRKWFFEDRYNELLNILQNKDFPMIGANTIGGEIANNRDGYLEYLNRTCVAGYIGS